MTDYTQDSNFWKRLREFVKNTHTSDLAGEEEKQMIWHNCDKKIKEYEEKEATE